MKHTADCVALPRGLCRGLQCPQAKASGAPGGHPGPHGHKLSLDQMKATIASGSRFSHQWDCLGFLPTVVSTNLYHPTQSHKNVELMLFYYVLVDKCPLDTLTTVSNEIKVTSAGLRQGTPGNRLEGGDREVRKTAQEQRLSRPPRPLLRQGRQTAC